MTKERQQKNKAPWTAAAQPTNISCTVIYFIIIFIIIIMQKLQTTLQTTMQFNSVLTRPRSFGIPARKTEMAH